MSGLKNAAFSSENNWIATGRFLTTLQQQQQQLFYGSMDFVRDNLGEPVPEETFTHCVPKKEDTKLAVVTRNFKQISRFFTARFSFVWNTVYVLHASLPEMDDSLWRVNSESYP